MQLGTDAQGSGWRAISRRERLWALVVEEVDAATARACVFTAAVLAAEQAREVPQGCLA